MLTLKISSARTDELVAKLRSIEGIHVDVNQPNKSNDDSTERTLKSEAVLLVAITITALAKVAPKAIEAIRDIVLEYMRSKRSVLVLKLKDGSEVLYLDEEGNPQKITEFGNEITKLLSPGD